MKKYLTAGVIAVAAFSLAACTEEAKAEGAAAVASTEFTPFVGLERETKADNTTGYVGVGVSNGPLDLTVQVDMEGKSANRGDVNNVNLDGTYAVTDDFSVYAENDFTSSFDRTETKVGVKYTFN